MEYVEKRITIELSNSNGEIDAEYIKDNNGYMHLSSFAITDGNLDCVAFYKERDAIELIKKLNELLELDMLK